MQDRERMIVAVKPYSLYGNCWERKGIRLHSANKYTLIT